MLNHLYTSNYIKSLSVMFLNIRKEDMKMKKLGYSNDTVRNTFSSIFQVFSNITI